MALDYSGLFTNPAEIRSARIGEIAKQQQALGQMGGSMAGLLGQIAGGGNIMGQMLAEGIAGAAGLKTTQEKQAAEAQQIFKNIDQNDPQSYYAAAKALNDAGLTKASLAIFDKGKALETATSQEASRIAQERRDKVRFLWESEKNAKTKADSDAIRAITMRVPFDATKPFNSYNELGKALLDEGHFEAGNEALKAAREYISSSDDPASVAEFKFFQSLPKEKQSEFLMLQRAGKVINDGKAIYTIDPDGTRTKVADIQLKPNEEPDVIRAQETAKKEGQIIGETAAELENNALATEASIDRQLETLDDLLTHPGFSSAVGWQANFPTVAGTEVSDFESQLEKARGQTFLVEIKNLQGMGALSEKEGDTATAAANALKTATSEAQFRKEAATVRKYLLLARLRAKKTLANAKQRKADTMQKGEQASTPASAPLVWNPQTGEWE